MTIHPPSTQRFDVLDRHLDLQRNYLLEASAGTGKTFSIENIVLRLLIAPQPLLIEEILVVTFTRAATRDLIHRIRSTIVKALDSLECAEVRDELPDYLRYLVEQGAEAVALAKRQLEQALFAFDDAQIYTIHSFCHRMLLDHVFEGGMSLDTSGGDKALPPAKIVQVIRDFLRTQLDPRIYGQEQIQQLLDEYNGDTLLKELLYIINKGIDVACDPKADMNQPEALLARLARDCQIHFKKYLEEEELFGFDDILLAMRRGVAQPQFAERVRARYHAAIIDEFQDTDPVQWEIFKTLFLPQDYFKGYLYLVGDPKQSIYAFRRADVYTYLAAAQALGPGSIASLDVNYRSQPLLVHALNVLFTAAPAWIPLPKLQGALPYQPVQANPKAVAKSFNDALGCVHFFVAEVENKSRSFPLKDMEENYFFPFIVQEIRRLTQTDAVALKKCAVLVKDRYQAERLMAFLKLWGIPALNQRQELLGASIAISALRELLEGVLNPRQLSKVKTVLGGPLLGWTHDQVRHLEDPLLLEKVLACFYGWRHTLMQEGFTPFYLQVLQTRFPLNQRIVSESLLTREGGLALYQDLLHAAEILAEVHSSRGATPDSLIDRLDDIIEEAENEDAGLKRRPETDSEAIQILTMHASKGLEFDVVFALGLAVRTKEPKLLISVADGASQSLQQVQDREDPRYRHYVEECEAEKMRQLYVAMTRAKYRLYVPVIDCGECWPVKLGAASPMELFLSRLGYPASTLDEVYQRLSVKSGAALIEKLQVFGLDAGITCSRLNDASIALMPIPAAVPPQLIEPPTVHVPGQPLYLHSFSGLSKGASGEQAHSELAAPHDVAAENKTPHTLPAGSDIGNLLHQLLEDVPFQKVGQPAAMTAVLTPLLRSGVYKEWEEVIAQVVYNALHTPLPLQTGPTALVDIDARRVYRETEFLYPWDQQALGQDMEVLPGFLKGVIDLVFEHRGFYYLLDWKSNWLGLCAEDYHRSAMEREMEKNNYFLQAKIYREALRRYLKIVDPRPFEDIFGGTFYVFLRGLDLRSGTGIYKIKC